MAKTILQGKCPFCGKITREVSRYTEDSWVHITQECGHTISQEAIVVESEEVAIVSEDGREPFEYQWTTTRFMEKTGCNGLILHEQGLGKTIIECMLLLRNKKDLLPALIVCPSGLRLQWMKEVYRWTGIMPQVITSSNDQPMFEVFPIVIVSIDTLRLLRPDVSGEEEGSEFDPVNGMQQVSKSKAPVWTDATLAKFKHICVDESQKIKNPSSSRTQALRKMAALANKGKKARVICMSGTNIEKHAGEFFVTLNLVRPELFPQEATFKLRHCQVQNETGKIGGLKNPEQFKDLTKDFIIRYKRADVFPDLPKVFRKFQLAEMENGKILDEYKKVVKDFQDYMDEVNKIKNTTDILGYLTRMRRITGIAKVNAAAKWTEEFLLSNEDDRKLVIFLHHKEAGARLLEKLTEVCEAGAFNPPLYLHAELDVTQRTNVVEEFKKPGNRIMLASTQAAGTGLNLQFCSDCLIMERQWNPSTEEQAEGRFPRPGSTADQINATYLIAAGTIDDFLTQIVEDKRRNVKQTLDFEEVTWDERSIITQLADILRVKGLQQWRLGNKR